jgi:hypothetical protein
MRGKRQGEMSNTSVTLDSSYFVSGLMELRFHCPITGEAITTMPLT